ncbi:MAG: hypothetical protein AAF402_16885 [Pseudomonadota bacterium]
MDSRGRVRNAIVVESEVLAHEPVALVTLIDNAGGYASATFDSITMEFNNRSSCKMRCANGFRKDINSSEFDVKPSDLHVSETAFAEFDPNMNPGHFITFAYYPESTFESEIGFYSEKPNRQQKQRCLVALACGRSLWPDQTDFQIQGVLACFPEQDFDPEQPDGMVATILNGYFSTLFGAQKASRSLAQNHYSFSSGWINHNSDSEFFLSALYKGDKRRCIRVNMTGGPALSRHSDQQPKLQTLLVGKSAVA